MASNALALLEGDTLRYEAIIDDVSVGGWLRVRLADGAWGHAEPRDVELYLPGTNHVRTSFTSVGNEADRVGPT